MSNLGKRLYSLHYNCEDTCEGRKRYEQDPVLNAAAVMIQKWIRGAVCVRAGIALYHQLCWVRGFEEANPSWARFVLNRVSILSQADDSD